MNMRPFDSSPGLGRDSYSGFRPTGVLEGATALPVGLHAWLKCFCGLGERGILSRMKMKESLIVGLVLLCGCATGPVSPGMTLLAGINHYQGEMEAFGARPERWPERQRMAEFLMSTFAVTLGRSPEFKRLVELDLRKREFMIALVNLSSSERAKEMRAELATMNEESDALKAAVKRQIAAIPVAAQEPNRRIEGFATVGLLTLAIDGFFSASNPTGALAATTKVGPYVVTDMRDAASVQTPEGTIFRCSTFVVQDEGAGINCAPVKR